MIDPRFAASLLTDLLVAYNPERMLLDGHPPHNLAIVARAIADARQPAAFTSAANTVLTKTELLLRIAAHRLSGYAAQVIDYIETRLVPPITSVGSAWPGRENYLHWFIGHISILAQGGDDYVMCTSSSIFHNCQR